VTGSSDATVPWVAPAAPPIPERIGRYEVKKLLGRGGMGSVYLAHQRDLDRLAVIKVISPGAENEQFLERFQREARAAAKASSDNVVQVFETGVDAGMPFIAMEFVDGESAAGLLASKGPLPWREATRIVLGAARGLAAAHAVSVLHRDVKPANILVANDGRVKVADFGIAKVPAAGDESVLPSPTSPQDAVPVDTGTAPGSLTLPGSILGTPSYMSPEQASAETVDARSDVYSLGSLFTSSCRGTDRSTGRRSRRRSRAS
jgi:eukaryotic-like serine/threonine-protein kinase